MKKELLDTLYCPECHSRFLDDKESILECEGCHKKIKMINNTPIFSEVPSTIEPWEKIERGPNKGTLWRRSNWVFLENSIQNVSPEALILDVGAGHGDFADIFVGRKYYSVDIVPYDEVDIVVDLGQSNPFKPSSFNVIILMNVLEHVYESRELLRTIASILAPGGVVIVTVPFLLKVHQAPFDFSRYTPFSLRKLAEESELQVESLKAYYDTNYLLNESLGNVWQYSLPSRSGIKTFLAKILVFFVQKMVNLLAFVTQKGFIAEVSTQSNPAPVGYLLVLRK
ncbi:MAG: class I SAM-dependent methyltransferase [Chloroflexi bacterium]|nr:class I SAM-dependent methyltransferase [Chloroflexota bacterium]